LPTKIKVLEAGLLDYPRSERKRVVSMEEKVLGRFVSATLRSRPNAFSSQAFAYYSVPDFERKTDSQSMKILIKVHKVRIAYP